MKDTSPIYTDDVLVALIQGSEKQRDEAIQYVLKNWRSEIGRFLYQKGASKAEIDYIIEEALVIFDKHIRARKFRQESSLKTFLISICKFTLLNKARWENKEKIAASAEEGALYIQDGETPLTQIHSQERTRFVHKVLAILSPRCRELLTLYMLSFTNREIKEQMNLPSDNAVSNGLYECRQKFKQLCEKSPLFKKIIQELLGNE